MTQQELLRELNTILDDLVGASDSDKLVSRSLKLRFLDEGQNKFCEETGLFIDASSAITTLTTVSGQKSYPISDKIIKVMEIWDGTRKLCSIEDDPQYTNDFQYDTPGTPFIWRTDWEPGKVTLHQTPNEVITLQMRVWRYPLNPLTTDDPEIPERFQSAAVEWALYRILNLQDVEIQNKGKSFDHINAFNMYVGDGIKYVNRLKGTRCKQGCDPVLLLGMS